MIFYLSNSIIMQPHYLMQYFIINWLIHNLLYAYFFAFSYSCIISICSQCNYMSHLFIIFIGINYILYFFIIFYNDTFLFFYLFTITILLLNLILINIYFVLNLNAMFFRNHFTIFVIIFN